VLLARLAGLEETGLALTALAAFLGHLYPVFFGFEGGKGVATAFGAILGLSWPVALAALAAWLFMAFVVRISSLSALTAAALTPLFAGWFGLPGVELGVILGMVGLLVWRHRPAGLAAPLQHPPTPGRHRRQDRNRTAGRLTAVGRAQP